MAVIDMALDVVPVDIKLNTHDSKGSEVWRIEGCHFNSAFFGDSIPSQKLVGEEDHNLWDVKVTCNEKRTKKVVNCIVFKFKQRYLRACNNYSLVEVLKHK